MTDPDPTASQKDDGLLAPPPFGVAETTGGQLLPISTSMEELLEATDEEIAAGSEPLVALEDIASPEDLAGVGAGAAMPTPAPAEPEVAVRVHEEPEESGGALGRTIIIGVVIGLLVGGGAWLFLRDGRQTEEAPAVAEKTQPAQGATPAPADGSAAEEDHEPPRRDSMAEAELPSDLEALRELSYAERHKLLGDAKADVNIEHNVGLDLIQAASAPSPCRTFGDALGTIEASDDQEAFRWAIDEASPPAGDDAACAGLPERLAALQTPNEDVAPEAATRRRGRRGRNAKRPRPSSRPSGTGTPAAAPEPTKEPTPQTKPSPKTPNVATKLDDDLRGLGD